MNAVGSRSSRALLLGMLMLYPPGSLPLADSACSSFWSCSPWPETQDASSCLPAVVVIWIVWFLSVIRALLTWPELIRLTISEVSTCW